MSWKGADVTAPLSYRVAIGPGVDEDWPLSAPTPAVALRLRIDPARDAAEARRLVPGRVRLGVLHATTVEGAQEDLPVETDLSDGAGEREIRLWLSRPATLARLRYRHEDGAPAATLSGVSALREDGAATTVLIPSFTEDRI